MKSLQCVLICLFFSVHNGLIAQNEFDWQFRQGIDVVHRMFSYDQGAVLGVATELGVKNINNYLGIRYSAGLTALQPSWQDGFFDFGEHNMDFELKSLETATADTYHFANSLTKYESISFHMYRKKARRAGYLDLQIGYGHFRKHKTTTLTSSAFIITTFPPTPTVFSFTRGNYVVHSNWRYTASLGLAYEWKNFDFSYKFGPLVQSNSLSMTYKQPFGEKANYQKEITKKLRFKLSANYGQFYALSRDKGSGASLLTMDLAFTHRNAIIGTSVGAVMETFGVDQRLLPDYFNNTNSRYLVPQFSYLSLWSAYVGRPYQVSNKESWFWAIGADALRSGNNDRDVGLQARLGWQAKMWSGALVYHVPFTKQYASFLEYTIGVGLARSR